MNATSTGEPDGSGVDGGGGGLPPALSIVTLGVADVERAASFYRALGWPHAASSQPAIIHWFGLNGVWLGLFERNALAADSGITAAPSTGAFCGVTLAINLGSRDAVDTALAMAEAAGATVTLRPELTTYGVYHACFADPDGYVWEVAHNPGFPIVEGRTVIP
jgi:catechol 2,3-dioxygenase-like lactoylglutathione lyase family enzyme